MVFITAGMGGGTGSGAAPGHRRDRPRPGRTDHRRRHQAVHLRRARAAASTPRRPAEQLRDKVDTLITIPNDRLKDVVKKNTSIVDAFRVVDDVLRQGVQGISDLITVPGPDQPGLRRRAHDHEGRRLGADGHRPRQRREPRRGGRPAGHRQPAAGDQHRRRPGRPVQRHRRPDLGLFEVDEAAEIIKRDRRPGGQHHLRHGHRRAHGRRGRRSPSSPPASTCRASASARRARQPLRSRSRAHCVSPEIASRRLRIACPPPFRSTRCRRPASMRR